MSAPKILITGGAGYIGAHTVVDLIQKGFEVIVVDSLIRSDALVFQGMEAIVKQKITRYTIDVCNKEALEHVFQQEKNIIGTIHFAAFKSVPESVAQPLLYYHNNIVSWLNLLEVSAKHSVQFYVFSSSCSVYGTPDKLPVTEQTPLKNPESPYAATKQMCESILMDFVNAHPNTKAIILRYFNPVGAHVSGKIGEFSVSVVENLLPVITQTAIGLRHKMIIHGNDYPTRDGTCLRDYVHVQDIAAAHTLSLKHLINNEIKLPISIFNLGSGKGVTVLEMVQAFENITNQRLNYEIGPRREGDVAAIYADNSKAKEILAWIPKLDLNAMMESAWLWENNRSKIKT